jgi:hypothetical protein
VLHKRRLIAFICLVAVVLAALTPAVSITHLAVLVPVDPLFGLVVIAPQPAVVKIDPYQIPVLAVAGSRPPPAL